MLSTKTVASGGLERRSLAEMQWMEGFAECYRGTAGTRYVPDTCTRPVPWLTQILSLCPAAHPGIERIIAEDGLVGPLLLLVMANTPALLFTVCSSWNADLHK